MCHSTTHFAIPFPCIHYYDVQLCNNLLYNVPLQELLSALRLAIDNDNQDRVVDAFLDRHPDVKPGLRGAPEIDWTDKVYTKMVLMNIAVCCVYRCTNTFTAMFICSQDVNIYTSVVVLISIV